MNRLLAVELLAFGLVLVATPSRAQDWTTMGNDAQRSSWLRSDSKLSIESVQSPDFQFLWKHEFDNDARMESALTPPVLLDFLISHKGFRSLAFVGGSGNNVFAIDTDLARLEWERRLGEALEYPAPTPDCPGGMTASLTRPTDAALPAIGAFSGGGRRSPGVSAVGEPNQGAVTLASRPSVGSRSREPAAESPRRQAPARRRLRGLTVVYALTSDGLLRTMLVSDGYDYEPPVPFLPANANAHGLIVVDEVAYVTTSKGCNGVPDGVWALDLESKEVRTWKAGSGSVAGAAGPVIAPDGTIYVASSDGRVAALEPKTLSQKGLHQAPGVSFASSPVLIDINDKDYLAVAAADGAVHLIDAGNLDVAAVDKTPSEGRNGFSSGTLATWRDSTGGIWLLAPNENAIAAWKIVETDGRLAFEHGWTSSRIAAPLSPIIVNGVVFAASGGDVSTSGAPAVVYAFDGVTGKTLWDSGDIITAAAPAGGLSAGGGRVYLGAHDGALYAFGFLMEH